MKNIMKKVIAVFAVLCVVTTSFASCGDKPADSTAESSSSVSISDEDAEALKKYPLVVGEAGEGNQFAIDDPNADLSGDDPTETTKAAVTAAPVTEVQDVTNADGQVETTVVEVTNADGEKQTDADKKPVTETVKVTTVVTKETEAAPETPAASDYKPKRDGRYAMWLDVSKDENFMFNGDMLYAKFKVKDGIPDGDYKINISPDLSDIAGVSVYPSKVLDSIVRVNSGSVDEYDVESETGLVFYGNNIACKQGDEIEFKINVKNNPGLAAFCIWFYFDSNALEFIEAGACGEYEAVARETEIGSGNKAQE